MRSDLLRRIREVHEYVSCESAIYKRMHQLLEGISLWLIPSNESPLTGEALQEYKQLEINIENYKDRVRKVIIDAFMELKDLATWRRERPYNEGTIGDFYTRIYHANIGGGYELRLSWANIPTDATNSIEVTIRGIKKTSKPLKKERKLFGVVLWTSIQHIVEEIAFPRWSIVVPGPSENGPFPKELEKEVSKVPAEVRGEVFARFISLRNEFG